MRKFVTLAALAGVAALGLTACSGQAPDDTTGSSASPASAKEDMRFVNVVKLAGVAWFDRMEVGIQEYADETGIDASQTGGDDSSPEKQVSIVQDLLAQNPTAIGVVPNSPESLEAVLERARELGIIVVSHEASNQQNIDADIEAFDNESYGVAKMDALAQCMGGDGKYVAFVGNLTATTHMEWVDAALRHAEAEYPEIERVEDPLETRDDEATAYERTKEILAKYPDIKGFQGSSGGDAPGIARAIQEAGLEDETCVVGTNTPMTGKKYLEDGSIDQVFFWDPALTGKAMMVIMERLASGEVIEEGTDLGIPGYESLTVSPDNPKVFYGDAALSVDASNVDDYDF